MTTMTNLTETRTDEDLFEKEEIPENTVRHIINPPGNTHVWRPGMSAQDVVDVARVRRIYVVALCGFVFIPTKDPESVKETCDACVDIAGQLMAG